MKVAIAQMNTTPGDFDATVDAMLAYGRAAAEAEADLVVYPTPALCGVDSMALSGVRAYLEDVTHALMRLASELTVPAIVPYVINPNMPTGFDVCYVHDGAPMPVMASNAVGSLGKDELEALARQNAPASFLPALAQSLTGPVCVSVDGYDVGVALTFDDLEAFAAGDAQADVICFVPADGFCTDDEASCLAPSVSDGCFVQDASDANAWLVCANAAGAYEESVFAGGSFVMAPWGELSAVAPSFAEDLLVCDIDVLSEGPLAEPVEAPSYDRAHILWDACVTALRDQVAKRGLAGVTLVLDGSLRSSTLAALAVDAVGPTRVSALVCAPAEDAHADARAEARTLRARDVDELSWAELMRVVDALGGGGDEEELARGLVETRLGAQARSGGLLVLSDADKTALALLAAVGSPSAGATSYAPFGDVYRSDLARMARYRNTVSPVIPRGALARLGVPRGLGLESLAVSDELIVSELDAALLTHIERGAGVFDLAAGRLGQDRARRLVDCVWAGEAARRSGPLYPLLSSRTLDEASRPVCSAWCEHGGGRGPVAEGGTVPEALEEMAREVSGGQGAPSRSSQRRQSGDASQQASRFSEVMGYLQELSDGQRMRGASGSGGQAGGHEGGSWPPGMFSEN